MIKTLLAGGALGFFAVPAIAILALSVGSSTMACLESSTGGPLATDAPVPVAARAWIAETKAECPDLPEAWIAAVMAQESGFRPDAYADDSNGGTWGLFQMNQGIWTATYGHPWTADQNANGVLDVIEPDIHARVGGQYLCNRLVGVREIRAQHPDWASSQLPVLDALIIAHNAGESRLRTYPAIPGVTAKFITAVDRRVSAWSAPSEAGALPEPMAAAPVDGLSAVPAAETSVPYSPTAGCLPRLGSTGSIIMPAGTPNDVATAVQTAMSYVGVRSGWTQLCDRLVCRAYGYANSGYASARAHWFDMVATGHAHPGDPCPPLGSFVFWNTGRPFGHVSVVVQANAACDPNKIMVTANEVFDSATGNHGGVYLLSFAHLNGGYVDGRGFLGWADPVCKGAQLRPGTANPSASRS